MADAWHPQHWGQLEALHDRLLAPTILGSVSNSSLHISSIVLLSPKLLISDHYYSNYGFTSFHFIFFVKVYKICYFAIWEHPCTNTYLQIMTISWIFLVFCCIKNIIFQSFKYHIHWYICLMSITVCPVLHPVRSLHLAKYHNYYILVHC